MKRTLVSFCVALAGVAAATVVTTSEPAAVAAPSEGFLATFDSPDDFYSRFDYGFSGQDPAATGNSDRLVSWLGDHDQSCGAPTTLRTIDIDRNTSNLMGGTYEDFDDMFWWCRGHMMTAVNTIGYTIAWFSPKPFFTDITRVCWDKNVTDMSSRKWTQVLFVSETDAYAHPSARGSGGYDLGYTNPIFRGDPGFPSAEILPVAGDLAGLQIQKNGYFRWFEGQDHWTTDAVNASQSIMGVTDKATRYTHCIEQIRPGTIRFTQQRPASHGGYQSVDVPGNIPRGPVKVVFQDDNYNGPKGENHNPEVLTWHWDNIVVETGERLTDPNSPYTGPSTPSITAPSASANTARLVDTRSNAHNVTADGQYQGIGKVGPGNPIEVQVAGRGGVPAGATAAHLNVTATQTEGAGHVTLYPCGAVPQASTLNFSQAGQTVANLAYTPLSASGTVCISSYAATHLVIDATDPATVAGAQPVGPARLLESRSVSSMNTVDGRFSHTGKVRPGQPLEIDVAGRGGVPGNATGAYLNITGTLPDAPGHVTVYPCGSQPSTSTLNFAHAGQTVANLAFSELSGSGSVCIASSTPTDVVVDVTGYSTSDSPASVRPARLVDSRSNAHNVTVDGRFQGVGKVTPGNPLEIDVAGRGGVPDGASAAYLNITATQTDGPGHITVYDCGEIPWSSTLNFTSAGQTVANLAFVELSDRGTVCVDALTATHLVVDVTGHVD